MWLHCLFLVSDIFRNIFQLMFSSDPRKFLTKQLVVLQLVLKLNLIVLFSIPPSNTELYRRGSMYKMWEMISSGLLLNPQICRLLYLMSTTERKIDKVDYIVLLGIRESYDVLVAGRANPWLNKRCSLCLNTSFKARIFVCVCVNEERWACRLYLMTPYWFFSYLLKWNSFVGSCIYFVYPEGVIN